MTDAEGVWECGEGRDPDCEWAVCGEGVRLPIAEADIGNEAPEDGW